VPVTLFAQFEQQHVRLGGKGAGTIQVVMLQGFTGAGDVGADLRRGFFALRRSANVSWR
jgi:hypothetical protein